MHLKYSLLFFILIGVISLSLAFFLIIKRLRKKSFYFPQIGIIANVSGSVLNKFKTRFLNICFYSTSVVIVLILIILVSRPQSSIELTESKKGLDIILVMDGSGSMLTEDVAPSRLGAARLVIKDFIQKLKNDRVALVSFSGSALTLCPLTYDYNIVDYYMELMEDGKSTWFLEGAGTAIGDAILLASQKFQDEPNRTKLIILLTDGDSNLGIDPVQAAELAKEEGIKIYSIYISASSWDYAQESLAQVSEITDAKTYNANDKDTLDNIFNEIDSLERKELKATTNIVYKDEPTIFFILLSIVFALFIIISSIRFSI